VKLKKMAGILRGERQTNKLNSDGRIGLHVLDSQPAGIQRVEPATSGHATKTTYSYSPSTYLRRKATK
jgi:hypothetical protein